jgi:trk/ktr system potassium uptake protein
VNVLIVGAGRLGEQAAHLLAATGHTVTVLDRDRAPLERMEGWRLSGTRLRWLAHGDACEPHILEQSGALNADLLLAATGEDEDNLVIALLAKRQFGVERTLVRVNDPDNSWLFDERWGVDVALPATAPLVSLVEEAAGLADTIGLVRLAAAGVSLIETHISPHSAAAGHTLGDITLPGGTVVATVIHDAKPIVPGDDYRFRDGDTVLVVTHTATEHEIHDAFQ